MCKSVLRFGLAVATLLTAELRGQLGDRSEKTYREQKAIVPDAIIPPSTPLSPQEALPAFRLAEGIKLEIAACEPLIQDPVAIAFGADGRMWVVEMIGYMSDLDGTDEDKPIGRVVVLRDRDGDGRYDEASVFVDHLVLPRAIALWRDGVIVGAPPELAFWRDTDGDGKADQKTVIASDYGVQVDPKRPFLGNPERAPNSLLWAGDNWLYSAAYTKKFHFVDGEWKTAPTLFRGQWGLSEDDFGRLFYNSNSDQLRADVVSSDYLRRNANYPNLSGANVNVAADQQVYPVRVTPGVNRGYRPDMLRDGKLKEYTAACAPWIYGGDLMPEFRGNAFVAEPAANLVRRNIITPVQGTLSGRNAYDQTEFIASTDERFRPVNFATGPDGALYVVDFYRGVLQHRSSLTSYLRQQSEKRHLVEPRHWGRIYRVAPSAGSVTRVGDIATLSNGAWVERLSHANSWWRETAQRVLVEREARDVVPALRSLLAAKTSGVGRVRALWTLDGLGALELADVFRSLNDADAIVRCTALRLSERYYSPPANRATLVERALALARDSAPEVRLQAMLTLGEARDAKVDKALADVVRKWSDQPFLRDAFLSGLHEREFALLEHLLARKDWDAKDRGANQLLAALAAGATASRKAAQIERLFGMIAARRSTASPQATALLEGIASAVGSKSQRRVPLSQKPAGWSELERDDAFRPQLAAMEDRWDWPGKIPTRPAAEVLPLNEDQLARSEAGRVLFSSICAACHEAGGHGLEGLAPPLLDSEWVLGAAPRVIRIVLHGLRGPVVVTGRTHTGDMPAFGALDDAQIASVLTYLRRAWGHSAAPIDPDAVGKVRQATAGRMDAWSVRELGGSN